MIQKGDKVKFMYDGKEQKGIAIKGGKRKVEARIVGTDIVIGGSAGAFRLADFEIPKDLHSIMDKWNVTKYKEFGLAMDGLIYQAFITLNGVNIISVYNAGNGGETYLNPVNQGTMQTLQQFHNDTKAWVKQFGWEEDTDPFETWFDWNLDHRPFGILATDYLKKQKEEWEKIFPKEKK